MYCQNGRLRQIAQIASLACLWIGFNGTAQALAQQEQQPVDAHSIQQLADEVRQLHAAIQELRDEVSRSRQETEAAREELKQALDRVAPNAVGAAASGDASTSQRQPVISTTAAASSPEERLTRLEEGQDLLNGKLAEQSQTKIESASKYRVKMSGIVLFNAFGNRGDVDNFELPAMASPRSSTDTAGTFGATFRQSQLDFELYGPSVGGAQTSADLRFDFLGGAAQTPNGSVAGLIRMRTATMRMDWSRSSVVIGQDTPFFSPLSPTSIASLAYPAFSYSGNLWSWVPQARAEHRFDVSESNSISVQGGFLDPLVGDQPYGQTYRSPQAGEKSGQPAYASRLSWSHDGVNGPRVFGAGGFYSRQNYGAGRTVDAWAGTADWNVPLGSRLTLSGEFYRGRALGGLGGAQDRSAVFSGPQNDPNSRVAGLNTIGGWTQLKFKASGAVEFNAAYGEDKPDGHDLRQFLSSDNAATASYEPAARNRTGMMNMIYRPRTDLLFSLEYRRIDTTGLSWGTSRAGHINLGVGVLF